MMKILCLFIICWTRHYSSCIEDSRTNSTWIGSPLRIWCWTHEILVSQGTPIFRSHSGLSGFLGFLFWTTNSPCTRHTEKQTNNFIRRGFNQPFQYEWSVKVLPCQMFQCVFKERCFECVHPPAYLSEMNNMSETLMVWYWNASR